MGRMLHLSSINQNVSVVIYWKHRYAKEDSSSWAVR